MADGRRVAVFGFDSPANALVDRWLSEGHLPVLADLLASGTCVTLDSSQDLATPHAIPTVLRGVGPHAHGIVYPRRLDTKNYHVMPVDLRREQRVEPFWRAVHDAHLRSTILSPYGGTVVEGAGTQVFGFGCQDPFYPNRASFQSEPAGLVRDLERRFGKWPLAYGRTPPRNDEDRLRYGADALKGINQQASIVRELVARDDWELFIGAFSECHPATHMLWQGTDPEHPDHDPATAPKLTDSLLTTYRAVDRAIGDALEILPSEMPVFVVSAYSHGPNAHLDEALGAVLEAEGLAVRASGEAARPSARVRALGAGRRLIRATVPARIRPALARLVPRERWIGELALANMDWSHTRAFSVGGDGCSFAHVNVRGRFGQGCVGPGREYDSVCEEVTGIIEALVDADTGQPVASRVLPFAEVWGHEPWGHLPDLCVEWRRIQRPRAVRTPSGVEIPVPHLDRRGSRHFAPGFLIGRAPDIPASGATSISGAAARLEDFAPTIQRRLGIVPPDHLEGAAIELLAGAAERGG